MKTKRYLSSLCEKVYADQLPSGANQTRIIQGELIPRIKSCWRVRAEELKYLIVVRKYRLSLLPARIRSFCRRTGAVLSDLQLHAGQDPASCLCLEQEEWHLLEEQRRTEGGSPPCRNVAHVLPCVWWVQKRPPATSSSCITFAFLPQVCRQKHHASLLNWHWTKAGKWRFDGADGLVQNVYFPSSHTQLSTNKTHLTFIVVFCLYSPKKRTYSHMHFFLQFYLQARLSWRGARLLRPLIQFLLVMIAIYTGLTRISDYRHHPSDVVTGFIQGGLTAYWVVRPNTHCRNVTFISVFASSVTSVSLNNRPLAPFPQPDPLWCW